MLPEALREAADRGKIRTERHGDVEFQRVTDDFQQLRRGTVVIDGRIIYGYPPVGRILRLDTGLSEHFSGGFWAEEKVDGYNVRIVQVAGEVLALTRGGFVCPFSTDRLPDLLDLGVFEQDPDLVVCAEVAGPENPYNVGGPPQVPEDVALFVFDLMRMDRPGFLPHLEKQRLAERYGLSGVQCYGRFAADQHSEIRALLTRINAEGREGLVFKSEDAYEHRVKYVTSNSSIIDVEATMHKLLHLPPEYFTNRILRLALFLDEVRAEDTSDVGGRLGKAFVTGLLEALEQFKHERRVYDRYRCRFRDPHNAKLLLQRLKRADRRVHIRKHRLQQENGYYVLEFDKVYDRMTGLLEHLTQGGAVFD